MNTLHQYLSTGHRECDALFVAAEAAADRAEWEEARALLARFRRCTEHHFNEEEQILFPAFEAATGQTSGPTAVMRMEHRQMRQSLDALAEALDQQDQERYLGTSETLLLLMQQHNLKEENMLYRMADQVLAPQAENLLARMQVLPEVTA